MPNIKGKAIRFRNKFLSLSWKKKILAIVLVIVIASIAFSQFTPKDSGFTTIKASKSDITEVVSETGTISSSGTVSVYSPTNGTIKELSISNGVNATEGEILFSVESSATEQEQKAAYANYLSAKNTYDSAQSSLYLLQSSMLSAWDSYKQLAEGDKYENSDGTPKSDQRTLPEFHIAEKEWLAAELKYKNQQSVIAQAATQMSSTWILYQATQNAIVKAPANGTVSNLSIGIGGSVEANTPTSPQRPVLLLTNPSTTEIVLSLSESDISKIKPGQKAKIEVNAIRDKIYTGTVTRVDTVGVSDQGVVRYNAYIELSDDDSQIRSGMNADATITTNKLSNVLSVPNSAVKPYQGGRAVRIEDPKGEIKYVPVKIGVRGNTRTQILSGIQEGQEVITSIDNEKLKRSGGFFGG